MIIKKEDLARVLLHLYKNTRPLGMGVLQHRDNLTLKQVEDHIAANLENGSLYIDYFFGHPFKITWKEGRAYDHRLFDRDNGAGRFEYLVMEVLTTPGETK